MTWLGKILAVLVMVLALVWMWFTASVYVARTNWKNQSDAHKKAAEAAVAARTAEYQLYASEKDALARQLAAEQQRTKTESDMLAQARADNAKNIADLDELKKAYNTLNLDKTQLQAALAVEVARQEKTLARNTELENERVTLIRKTEQADRAKQTAEILVRQAQAEKLIADQRIEELTTRLADARGGSGGSLVPRFDRAPTPVAEGTRGTVQAYQDGLVVVSLGIDAGVTIGSQLDVYRETGGGKYLGTVVIDRATAKQAVGTFRPATPGRSIKQLRPDELPKVDDVVGRIGAINAGSGTNR